MWKASLAAAYIKVHDLHAYNDAFFSGLSKQSFCHNYNKIYFLRLINNF